MAQKYFQKFTLADIFNNKELKNIIPLVNYKEIEREDGKISRRTSMKSIKQLIVDTSSSAARPYYKPLIVRRSQGQVLLTGELVGDQDTCVEAVYSALLAKRVFMIWTANNMDMIRTALKESEENKKITGVDTKLFLRVNSLLEIKGMNWRQAQEFLNNIMENIYYSGKFPKTSKKYDIQNIPTNDQLSFSQRQLRWKYKVGDLK